MYKINIAPNYNFTYNLECSLDGKNIGKCYLLNEDIISTCSSKYVVYFHVKCLEYKMIFPDIYTESPKIEIITTPMSIIKYIPNEDYISKKIDLVLLNEPYYVFGKICIHKYLFKSAEKNNNVNLGIAPAIFKCDKCSDFVYYGSGPSFL